MKFNTELTFSDDMTSEDVCEWLKQNKVPDRDILHFKSKYAYIASYIEHKVMHT